MNGVYVPIPGMFESRFSGVTTVFAPSAPSMPVPHTWS